MNPAGNVIKTDPPVTDPPVTYPTDWITLDNTPIGWAHDYPDDLSKYNAAYNYGGTNIYLTFDLGYEGGYTAQILDTLKDKGVKAVFFLVGSYISYNPDLVKRIMAEGHLVGNHSYDHTYLDVLLKDSPAGLIEDLKQWDRVFGSSVKLYRPPSGVYTERAMAILRDLGYETLFWGAAYLDWAADDQPERGRVETP